MAINTNSISHKFSISSVSKTINIDTAINILRRREEILYKKRTEAESVNISFFSGKPLNSLTSLFIADRSTSLVANRIEEIDDFIVVDGVTSYTIETDQFVVTDIFTDNEVTIGERPLFYQHIIDPNKVARVSDTDLTIASGIRLISAEVLTENFVPVKVPDIKIDLTEGIIYNNLKSSYNPIDGDYIAYYIRYTVRVGNLVVDYTELLNNIPIYTVATFDDLDIDLAIIQDGRKVYLIEEVDNHFLVTLPAQNSYAFQVTSNSRLKITPPPPVDINSPWRVSISNTQFYTSIANQIYKYRIAEFLSQSWNPALPIKKSSDEESTILSPVLIKTNHRNIYTSEDEELFVDVLINDSSDEGLAAYTTDPDRAGVMADNDQAFQLWNNVSRRGIKSIDSRTGFIEVEGLKLKTTYKVICTYYFEEDSYEFTIMDFNPINNPSILNQRVTIFIEPEAIGEIKTDTLKYLISDKSGKVIQSNWNDFDNDNQTTASGNLLYYESIPNFLEIVPDGTELFIPTYSTEGSGVLLTLGDLYITEEGSPETATLIDVRVPGGGVIESMLDEAKDLNIETNWFWDVGAWDGTPYPGNASFMVEVPVEILEGAGGEMLSNEVKDIIDRHVATGVYPIVKAYGVDPTISGVDVGANSIALAWGSNAD